METVGFIDATLHIKTITLDSSRRDSGYSLSLLRTRNFMFYNQNSPED